MLICVQKARDLKIKGRLLGLVRVKFELNPELKGIEQAKAMITIVMPEATHLVATKIKETTSGLRGTVGGVSRHWTVTGDAYKVDLEIIDIWTLLPETFDWASYPPLVNREAHENAMATALPDWTIGEWHVDGNHKVAKARKPNGDECKLQYEIP